MSNKETRLEIKPTHLEWLASALFIDDKIEFPPCFEDILKSMPSGLYRYPKETEILKEGEITGSLYVVYTGELSVLQQAGGVKRVATLKPGDLFGEISFLLDKPHSATVKTLTECVLFKFQASEFAELMNKHEHLAKRVAEITNKRLGLIV